MVQVGEDHVGEIDFQEVHFLAQDQREQQIERAREDVEVQLEPGRAEGWHRRQP
jgi:hypothetical protein